MIRLLRAKRGQWEELAGLVTNTRARKKPGLLDVTSILMLASFVVQWYWWSCVIGIAAHGPRIGGHGL